MKIKSNSIRMWNTVFFVAIFLLSYQFGHSQKNQFRITPLKPVFDKINFSYERNLNKKFTLTFDYQRWFKDKRFRPGKIFGTENLVRDISKGNRISMEIRRVKTMLKKEKKEHKIYLGIGAFTGQHFISRKEFAHYQTPLFSLGPDKPEQYLVSEKYGEVDLMSSGVRLAAGMQFIYWDAVVLDFGLAFGQSWINKDVNALTLNPSNPKDRIESYPLERNIKGKFLEPKFSIGFVF